MDIAPHSAHQTRAGQGEDLSSLLSMRRVQQLQAALRRTRLLLDQSNERFAKLAHHLPVACLYIDRERRFRFINKTYQRWHGLPESSFKDRLMSEVFSDSDSTGARYRDVAPYVDRALAGEEVSFQGQRLIEGMLREVELTYVPDVVDGEVVGFFGLMRDVTDRKLAQLYQERMATHDQLTGLVSRGVALERVEMALARADRHGKPLALLTINLNRFKQINDLHGHAAGDRALMQFADTLRQSVRKVDTVARLRDDEFMILAEELAHGESDAILIAEKVIAALRGQNQSSGYHIQITASIGIAVQTAQGGNAQSLLALSHGAMLQSKEAGDSSWALA